MTNIGSANIGRPNEGSDKNRMNKNSKRKYRKNKYRKDQNLGRTRIGMNHILEQFYCLKDEKCTFLSKSHRAAQNCTISQKIAQSCHLTKTHICTK